METKKTVFIMGIAGSLGRAWTRRLRKDYHVMGCDNSEWAVAEFEGMFPDVPIKLMDYSEWRFNQDPCDYLIVLSAYKHLPLGEKNVWAFIENNLVKLKKVFDEAYKYNVDTLFQSTDKACEPISTYGFTKALGEDLAEAYDFSVSRLGNILSSTGSVIPLWEKQIKEGLPITITDERMVRYVIEDFEAVDQIWDMFGAGKKLIIPQCREVRLMDLLTEVLKKKDLTIDDITVEVIGLRKGEKLREVLEWTS